jgi:hypothetical protein
LEINKTDEDLKKREVPNEDLKEEKIRRRIRFPPVLFGTLE